MTAPSSARIHLATQIGFIALTVSELDRSLEFYQQALGLRLVRSAANTVELGVPDNENQPPTQPLITLTENRAGKRPANTTGLYHLAILFPNRTELAVALRRLERAGVQPQGMSDHRVSEAIYLTDPDGNGIEIYRDRPESEWYRNGQINMTVDPLDLSSLLAEPAAHHPSHPAPAGTRLGHVHLRVADIAQAEDFYINILGFDLVQRYGRSASFVSAGGYHHHIGLNIWESAGAPPPPPGAIGLNYFAIRLPSPADLTPILDRLRQAGQPLTPAPDHPGAYLTHDPALNHILLTSG